MANRVLAVVKFSRVSGVPRDAVENTFALLGHAGGDVDLAVAPLKIADFYNRAEDVTGGTRHIHDYINQTVSRVINARIDMYHIGTPGPPIGSSSFALGAPLDGTCLPDASALAVTIHADLSTVSEHAGATRPRARRRGRVFLGPLIASESVDVTTGVPRINVNLQDTAGQAMTSLIGDLSDAANCDLAVWSRVDDVLRPVTGAWIDNRFDSQRRREEEATARTVYLS